MFHLYKSDLTLVVKKEWFLSFKLRMEQVTATYLNSAVDILKCIDFEYFHSLVNRGKITLFKGLCYILSVIESNLVEREYEEYWTEGPTHINEDPRQIMRSCVQSPISEHV